ncbi:MAG: hypothetical protein ACK4TL_15545 [Hyphomicrobiaceae bacterium]
MLATDIDGYFLRRSGYSGAGMALDLVLGDIGGAAFVTTPQLTEQSLRALMQRPLCAALIVAGLAAALWNVYREIGRSRTHALADCRRGQLR